MSIAKFTQVTNNTIHYDNSSGSWNRANNGDPVEIYDWSASRPNTWDTYTMTIYNGTLMISSGTLPTTGSEVIITEVSGAEAFYATSSIAPINWIPVNGTYTGTAKLIKQTYNTSGNTLVQSTWGYPFVYDLV